MVLKRMPTRPAGPAPALTSAARRSRCMLQVLPSYHMLQMPTCGFCRSADVRPMPYSIACDAPWLRGCVTRAEYLFNTIAASLHGRRLRQLHRVEERHHAAELGAHHFDRVRQLAVTRRLVHRQARLVL